MPGHCQYDAQILCITPIKWAELSHAMTELLTAAQMRAIEQAAIDSGEVTGLELMERAGQGVVEAVFEQWPGLAGEGPVDSSERRGQPAGKRTAFEARTGGGL